MTDADKEQTQRILQTIEYGHLPPKETQRRLLALIQEETSRPDQMVDQALIRACMDLLERLQGETAPITPLHVEALKRRIAAAYQEKVRQRARRWRRLTGTVSGAAALFLFLLLSLTHGWIWFDGQSTPDEQQYLFKGHQISIAVPAQAVADGEVPDGRTIEVQDIAELDALLGRKSGIPEQLQGEWRLQHCYVNFTRGYTQISLLYGNRFDKQQTIVGVIQQFIDPNHVAFSFEQSYTGQMQQLNGWNVYVTENIDAPVAFWHNNRMSLLLSGKTSQTEVFSAFEIIMEGLEGTGG